MEEIIVIRAVETNGNVFKAIMAALNNYSISDVKRISTMLSIGEIEIHPEQRRVLKSGTEIYLNYGEFSILYCMARSPGQVFSREQLYNAAWNENYAMGTNTVDNTIWRLRSKLEADPKHPVYIKTVFRVGYKIEIP